MSSIAEIIALAKLSASGGGSGGDYFEIKIDWDAMTCNYSASEIREASAKEKPFIGKYIFDSFDEKNNTATIIEWNPNYGNCKYEYIVHEDKTVEELGDKRILNDVSVLLSTDSHNYVVYSANKLFDMYYDADLNNFPFFYMRDDDTGEVYQLSRYVKKSDGFDAHLTFTHVGTTSIEFIDLVGDSTTVERTVKEI